MCVCVRVRLGIFSTTSLLRLSEKMGGACVHTPPFFADKNKTSMWENAVLFIVSLMPVLKDSLLAERKQ